MSAPTKYESRMPQDDPLMKSIFKVVWRPVVADRQAVTMLPAVLSDIRKGGA